MRKSLRIVAAMLRLRLTRQAADPASFWSAFFVDTSVFALQAAVFWVIYGNADSIGGWGRWQTLFFVGTFMLIDALWMSLFFFGILGIPDAIRTGRLELYLAKPADPLVCLSFEKADPGSAFLLLPALALVIGSAVASGARAGPAEIIAYALAIAMMLLLMYDLMVLARTSAFRLGRTGGLQEAEGALVEFGFRLPGRALRGPWRILFRALLPYGLIASFPAEAFFREARLGTWAAAIATTAAFTVLTRLAWRAGLRSYTGTGS
jgi:ABC-2 type transport system permease protein